jgi:hypothetical protein
VKERGVRPVKILLPVGLAGRIDEAVASGLGGFHDRHSLVAAAIDAYLLDLVYANQGDQSIPALELLPQGVSSTSQVAPPAVARTARGTSVVDTASALVDEPLLGLHNRDWPSLWALGVLAEMSTEAAIPWHSFLEAVTSRAWRLGELIESTPGAGGRKAAALLPTNKAKAQAAESAFQSFAVAAVGKRPNPEGKFMVSGPLALWRAIAFTKMESELCVGLSDQGWDLLDQMSGLTSALPHGPDTADSFFSFLAAHSPTDWWGFETMLAAITDSPTRQKYLADFASARKWSSSVASSAAQGYLARGREWGLVEPKIINGRYLLTDFGKEMSSA